MWEAGLEIILIAAIWFGVGVVTALAFGALVRAGRAGMPDEDPDCLPQRRKACPESPRRGAKGFVGAQHAAPVRRGS